MLLESALQLTMVRLGSVPLLAMELAECVVLFSVVLLEPVARFPMVL